VGAGTSIGEVARAAYIRRASWVDPILALVYE